MIEILKPPPFATIQDAGRPGSRSEGLPQCGAIDVWSLRIANTIVGNRPDAPALEWFLGGGTLRFDRASAFCLAGAKVEAWLDGVPVEDRQICYAPEGAVLNFGGLLAGRILYIAIEGGIDVPLVLGSASTYLPGKFGGLFGRRLVAHDRIRLGPRRFPPPTFKSDWVAHLSQPRDAGSVRFISAAGWQAISSAARSKFVTNEFCVSSESNRAGVRLTAKLPCAGVNFAAPSEPVVPGTIELTNDGNLIVLLADGPTTGGYPKPGVVIQADIPVVAQRVPGSTLRFVEVTPGMAITVNAEQKDRLDTLARQVRPSRSRLPDLVDF